VEVFDVVVVVEDVVAVVVVDVVEDVVAVDVVEDVVVGKVRLTGDIIYRS
jgi:hypothetical protein